MGLIEGAPQQGMTAGQLAGAAQRFGHGFHQLVLAFHAIHSDPIAWKRYVRVCTFQALVTLVIAIASISTARSSSEGIREEKVRKALENITTVDSRPPSPAVPSPEAVKTPRALSAPVAPVRPGAAKLKSAAPVEPAKEATDDDEESDDDEPAPKSAEDAQTAQEAQAARNTKSFQDHLKKLQVAILALSKRAGATAVRRDKDFQESRADLDEQLDDLEDRAKRAQLTEEDKATLVQLGGELDVLEQKTKPGFWDSAVALALALYGALSVVQAGVVALSRDYHAAIARDASLLLGVAPEDPPLAPRIRINIPWVRRKFKQRTRSLMVFLPGVALITVAALPFPKRAVVTSVLTSLWATYWWVVWTASKSARAWEREGVARPPWFLRLWHNSVAKLPLVGWAPRAWEALWARFTRSSYSPAEAVEAQPVEFAGLAAARALQLIPLVKLFVRPLVPVAAAHLLAEHVVRSGALLGSPNERAGTAAQRAAVPASPGAIEARDEM